MIGIFGLSLYTTEKDLKEIFDKYGKINEVQVVYDHQVSVAFLTLYACRCNTDTVLVPMITIHSHAPLYDIVMSGTWTPSITCLQVDLMSPLIRMRHSVIR